MLILRIKSTLFFLTIWEMSQMQNIGEQLWKIDAVMENSCAFWTHCVRMLLIVYYVEIVLESLIIRDQYRAT